MRDLAPLCSGSPCSVTVCGGALEMPQLTWAEKGIVTLLQVYGARGRVLTLSELLALSADGQEACRTVLAMAEKGMIALDPTEEQIARLIVRGSLSRSGPARGLTLLRD